MNDCYLKQRIHIKYCVKLDKSASETLEMLKVVSDDEVLSRARDVDRQKRFEGQDALHQDDICCEAQNGPPVTHRTHENSQRARNLLCSKSQLSMRKIAEKLNLD